MVAPALLLAVPLLSGAAAAFCFLSDLDPASEGRLAAAALLGLIAAAGALSLDDRLVAAILIAGATLLAGLSLGVSDARCVYRTSLRARLEATPGGMAVTLRGVLREDASPTPAGVSLMVDVVGVEEANPHSRLPRVVDVRGGVRLSVSGTLLARRSAEWRAGRTIRAPAFLREPSTYLNPGTPDERPALARRGIVLVGSVKSGALIEVLEPGSAASEAAASLRAAVRHRIRERIGTRDARAAGIATAVLIGDRSGLESEDERRLQEAGTYHVIAISGGNVAILAMLAIGAARLLGLDRRVAAVVTAGLLLFYGAVAVGAASVTRAVTVAVVALLARALDHRVQAINVLASAAILATAVSPAVVLDPGFQLSFGATLGILLGFQSSSAARLRSASSGSRPSLQPADSWLPGSGGRSSPTLTLTRMLGATLCAEIALAPVSASVFGRISFAGFLLNFAAIPLMTMVQIAALTVAIAPAWLAPAAASAAHVASLAATGLVRSAEVVDWAPWLAHHVAPPAWWLVAAYYASAAMLPQRRWGLVAVPAYATAACLLLVSPGFAARDAVPPAAMPVRVVVLDVGQGDATVVSLPGGRSLLVDAGGVASFMGPDGFDTLPGFDIGERVISRVLRALRIDALEALVLTHGDPDHLLGGRGVMGEIVPRAIWEGVPVPPHQGLQSLAALARTRGVTWRTVQAGDADRYGDVEVRVLHPPPPDWERQRVRNEDSVVLEVRIGRVSIVLPGDIGQEAERSILPRLEPGRLVILKAPHHGSATSSTARFLERLRPAAVIFSCGRHNRFGHPHPMVVERYRAMGTAMFSTAEDGAVFVESDGGTVEVRGWRGREASFERLTESSGGPQANIR